MACLVGIQMRQILRPSYPTSHPTIARSYNFCRRGMFLSWTKALQPIGCKCVRLGCSPMMSSNGVFHLREREGVLLSRYPAVLTSSGQRRCGKLPWIRNALAVWIMIAPDLSALPFCAWVAGVERSTVIPFTRTSSVNSSPRDVSPSVLAKVGYTL